MSFFQIIILVAKEISFQTSFLSSKKIINMPRPGRILFADSLSSVNKMQVLFVKEPPYTSQPYIFPSKRLNTQGREQLGNSRKEGQWHPELFNINITEDYLFKSSFRPSLGL